MRLAPAIGEDTVTGSTAGAAAGMPPLEDREAVCAVALR